MHVISIFGQHMNFSFVQEELCIERLMNAKQQLSLKKLPDLIEHPKTENVSAWQSEV